MALLAPAKLRPNVEVILLIGPTGTGKSYFAATHWPDAYWQAPISGSTVFFTGYKGQNTIVLDEYRGWLPYGFLLRLLDRYPLQLPVHSSTVACHATTIVLTSNRHPYEWYSAANQRGAIDYAPLYRRFTKIFCVHALEGTRTVGEGFETFEEFDAHWHLHRHNYNL